MAGDDLRRRIVQQFSDAGDRADAWGALAWVIDTDRHLNLGYSPRGWPTPLGSNQRRLVDRVGDALAERITETEGVRLLDVGCGRGGPAVRLAERFGYEILGIDLVPENVAHARRNAAGFDAAFAVGDAMALPIRDGSQEAAVSIDALVYLPDLERVLRELARVLQTDAPLVVSDLVLRPSPTPAERSAADAFAETWDMPPLRTRDEHEAALRSAGFDRIERRDLTPHSVGRLRRYTTPGLWLVDGPLGGAIASGLSVAGIDPVAVTEQVRAAHRALPALRHVLVVAERG